MTKSEYLERVVPMLWECVDKMMEGAKHLGKAIKSATLKDWNTTLINLAESRDEVGKLLTNLEGISSCVAWAKDERDKRQ